MSFLTGLRRLSRALPIPPRVLHRLRRAAGLGFQISAFLRHGMGRTAARPGPGPICVVGFHCSVLGIGEAARAFSAALRAAGAEVVDWDISALFGHNVKLDGAWSAAPPPSAGAFAIHLNPRELVQLMAMTGGTPFKGRFCVGCWAWELEEIPKSWCAAFRYVDEVWTPSRFVALAVSARAPAQLPVRVLPHPLPPTSARPDRAAFGIPEDAVAVLTAFDIKSGFTRKNPIAAVRAFRAAHRKAPGPAVMICKVAGGDGAPELYEELKSEVGRAGDVVLMDAWLTGAQMATLTASIDIVLSLHRSEGFGLLPAQAMLAGKAVVATAWSGNLEYMTADDAALVDYRLIPVDDPQGLYDHGIWADPDVEQAAAQLAVLMADPDRRRDLGHLEAARVARVLGPVRLGRQARVWFGHTEVGV